MEIEDVSGQNKVMYYSWKNIHDFSKTINVNIRDKEDPIITTNRSYKANSIDKVKPWDKKNIFTVFTITYNRMFTTSFLKNNFIFDKY